MKRILPTNCPLEIETVSAIQRDTVDGIDHSCFILGTTTSPEKSWATTGKHESEQARSNFNAKKLANRWEIDDCVEEVWECEITQISFKGGQSAFKKTGCLEAGTGGWDLVNFRR